MVELISVRQWDFFLRHGYLIVESVLSVQRLQVLRETLEQRYELEGAMAGSEGGISRVSADCAISLARAVR